MTSLKDRFSALAVNSLEIARLRLRIARSSVRLAFLRLLIALVRAALALVRRFRTPDAPPPPTNDPCTPGK